ncbi:hypothetical protein XELAEV_18045795mg [Xenopus laevis]|uniref:Uncharacterized protein n=1 Tax=Xenopus laevis TaxID=8355 RepID=A0A974H4L3_XENLA|nr:hypothetical protein XELAEV_18045795mg [Xenopus laevis]
MFVFIPFSPKHIVGVTSRCPVTYLKWLKDLLKTLYSDLVLRVKYLPISDGNSRQWNTEVKACSIVILYHSTKEGSINITGTRGTTYKKELIYLTHHLGQEKVMVVLDDVKPSSEAEKERTRKSLNSLQQYCGMILLLPENSKYSALQREDQDIRKFLMGAHCIKRSTSPPTSSRSAKNLHQTYQPNPKPGRNMAHQSDIRSSFKTREHLHQSSNYNHNLGPRLNQPLARTKFHKVGIFSRAAGSHYQWLMNQLKAAFVNDMAVSFHSVPISNNYSDFTSELTKCTFAILYHTWNSGRLNVTDVPDSLYDRELKDLSLYLGKNNVLVVLDDLTDSGLEEKKKILQNQPSINRLAQELFLFSEKDKKSKGGSYYSASTSESQNLKIKLQKIINVIKDNEPKSPGFAAMKEGLKQREIQRPTSRPPQANTSGSPTNLRQGHQSESQPSYKPGKYSSSDHVPHSHRPWQKPPSPPTRFHKVGIFSRAAGSHYQWLVNQLKTIFVNDIAVTFHSAPISNKYFDFSTELTKCTFAILYHTLNSGRLNVTDVSDSLYDRELADLSLHLGKNNVIVILDDLMDSSPAEKKKILQNQPSIKRLAHELFLFSEKEKGSSRGSYTFDNTLESTTLRLKLEQIMQIINDNTGKAASKIMDHRQNDLFETEYKSQFTATQQKDDLEASLSPSKSDKGKPTLDRGSSTWETKVNISYDDVTDIASKIELDNSHNKGPTLTRSEEHVKKMYKDSGITGAPTISRARTPQSSFLRSHMDTFGTLPSKTPPSASYAKSSKATDHDQERPLSSLSTKNHDSLLKTEGSSSPRLLSQMQSTHFVNLMDNMFQQQRDLILYHCKSQLLMNEKIIKAWHDSLQYMKDMENKLSEYQHIIHKQDLTICKQENMIRQLRDTHPVYRQNYK